MLSEKTLLCVRKSATPLCIALSVAFLFPSMLHSAEERSYALEIRKYVDEDTVYLLENMQQNITKPSEKTVVEALLCESGPQAIVLFQKQLNDYPDPALDQLSNSRIAAYNLALNSTAPLPKLSRPLFSTKQQDAGVKASTQQQLASLPSKPKEEISPLPLPSALTMKLEATPPPSPAPVKPIQNVTPPASPTPVKPDQESTIARSTGFTLQFGYFASKANAIALTKKVSLYEPAEMIERGQFYSVRLKKIFTKKQDAGAMIKKLPFTAIIIQAQEMPH